MTAVIMRGDARHLPLADASVDLIVTSPPYYALRSYTDGGEHYDGQIGSEATPQEYVAALLECTREWMRVLKPEGSLWVNLGDKYNSAQSNQNLTGVTARPRGGQKTYTPGWRGSTVEVIGQKSLLGLPWRYALGCIDDLALILRAEVIWFKPNGLPESVTDRVRRSHETWFHFVRQPRYFSAVDEIREQHTAPTRIPGVNSMGGRNANITRTATGTYEGPSPLGKLPGSVWEIATQPLKVPDQLSVDHFAAFPMEWPRRIILGWSPAGICTACGEARRPVVERERLQVRKSEAATRGRGTANVFRNDGIFMSSGQTNATLIGYACACPDTTAPTHPAVVLDPFGGTGTTALVADMHGRHGISIDRSADYCRLAAWRTRDPGERARALGVPKPPPVMDGQGDLFAEVS